MDAKRDPREKRSARADARVEKRLLAAEPRLKSWAASRLAQNATLASSTTPDDIVQSALLAVFERLKRSRDESDRPPNWWDSTPRLEAYLYGVVRHLTGRVTRDPWNRRRLRLDDGVDGAAVPEPAAPERPPKSAAERAEDLRRLRECLETLGNSDRAVLLLHAAGHSYGRIAERLSLSPEAVAKRRLRALERLHTRCTACQWRAELGCWSALGASSREESDDGPPQTAPGPTDPKAPGSPKEDEPPAQDRRSA